jgi:hypothetical protein
MKITNLKIAKILSFGPLQEIDGLETFNLFIGKNGSGKSNVLKILKGLSVNYSMVAGKVKTSIQTHRGGHQIKEVNVSTPSIFAEGHENRESRMSNIAGMLEINYELITNIKQVVPTKKRIRFVDDADRILRYEEGDISELARRVSYIEVPKSEFEFFKDLSLNLGNRAKIKLPLLNFGLFYIFGLNYIFMSDGTFIQGKNSRGGTAEDDTLNLPSGVLYCAKILTRYFISNSDVILIDEPELHLEPRMIRRLFQFLVWLIIRWEDDKTAAEKKIFELVEAVRLANYHEDSNGKSHSIWAIFEGEANGEIRYTDIREEKQSFDRPKQLFLASHSSVLINEFVNMSQSSSIYEFDSSILEYKQTRPVFTKENPFAEELIDAKGLFTVVKKVDSNNYSLLDNLGCKGSDLLQANGIIWVEGPSDVVYVQKWIEMYIRENGVKTFVQGRDYEFQMFGGTLLDSLCYIKEGLNENDELKKLVSIFSFSKNAFVIIDSDAVEKEDKGVIDKSKFANAKKFIKEQFELLSKNSRSLGLWYKEGNIEIRTMESYLDDESNNLIQENSWTKKIAAQKVTSGWIGEKKLSDFKNNLKSEIEELYKKIEKWNE